MVKKRASKYDLPLLILVNLANPPKAVATRMAEATPSRFDAATALVAHQRIKQVRSPVNVSSLVLNADFHLVKFVRLLCHIMG